jgi:hypothetical protein
MSLTSLETAMVISQDPDNYGLNVLVNGGRIGGQGPALPVAVGIHGPRDAVRGTYPELPGPGTHGVVAFLRGDQRNGIWLCSLPVNLIDASAHAPGLGNLSHRVAFDGSWFAHYPDGTQAMQWPDGSSLLWAGSGTTSLPTPTRHVLDGSGARTRRSYPLSQRIASGASHSPFVGTFSHASSASVSLGSAGGWTVVAAPSQALNLSVSGGTSVQIAGDGSLTIQQAGGGTSVQISAAGAVTVTVGGGQVMTVTRTGGGAAKQVKLADNTNSSVLMAVN